MRRVCYPLFLHSVVPERFEEATCQAMSPTRSATRMPKILMKIIIVPIKIARKSSKYGDFIDFIDFIGPILGPPRVGLLERQLCP